MLSPEETEDEKEAETNNVSDFMDNNYWKCNNLKDDIDGLLQGLDSTGESKHIDNQFIINDHKNSMEITPVIVKYEYDLYYDNNYWKSNIHLAQIDFTEEL